jgi:hypothetical protein
VLTRGNHKLGGSLIWGFGLPAGSTETSPGMSSVCQQHCYSVTTERYRPAARTLYQRNLQLAQCRDFVPRVRAFLLLHRVRVLRLHVGGDYFSVRYARKWLRIMRRSPRTRFYFYTRSWRVPGIKRVIDRMADLRNCRVWYSADRDTGVPTDVPSRVRVAWLMTTPEDLPPVGTNLVFRVRRLRRVLAPDVTPTVCPSEDGQSQAVRITCERCGHCWHPLPLARTPLPVIETEPGRCP